MAKSATISIAILGDNSKFKRALSQSSRKLDDFASNVGSKAASVAKGFGVMTAAAGGLAVVAGKQLFDVAEELTSLDQKIGTVFSGQSLDQVTGWADEVAARMGLTATQAAGLAANAGDLLKPMGFTADEAANMSTEIVGLSGALSEWSGGQRSVEETASILQKALLGERESLKELGISINQAEVDQRAMTIAMADGRDEITAQDKALATQALIMEKSTDAQAAFAAGGNDLTAAQNKLKAAFGELQEDLARKLMPVFAQAASAVVELIDVFDRDGLSGVISNVSERIKEAWPAIREQLGVWAQGFVDWVEKVGPPFLAALGEWIADVAAWLVDDGLPALVEKLGEWANAFVDWIGPMIPPFLEKLGQWIEQVATWFVTIGLPTAVEKLAEMAAAFIDWIIPLIPPMLEKLGELLLSITGWIVDTGAPALIEKLFEWSVAFVDWALTDLTPKLLDAMGEVLVSLGGWFVDDALPSLIDDLADLGAGLFDAAISVGQAIVDGIIDGIKAAPGAVVSAIESLVPGPLKSVLSQIPGIGLGADGGIVTQPTLAVIGEAGPEAVVPLNQMPGASPLPEMANSNLSSSTTINVTSPASPADIEAAVKFAMLSSPY